MKTEDIPNKGPSDWQPITDKPTLALLGKLAEECAELSGIIARCIIQGLDGIDPDTGELNLNSLTEEIADVRGLSDLTTDRLFLSRGDILDRARRKYDYKKVWITALDRAKEIK